MFRSGCTSPVSRLRSVTMNAPNGALRRLEKPSGAPRCEDGDVVSAPASSAPERGLVRRQIKPRCEIVRRVCKVRGSARALDQPGQRSDRQAPDVAPLRPGSRLPTSSAAPSSARRYHSTILPRRRGQPQRPARRDARRQRRLARVPQAEPVLAPWPSMPQTACAARSASQSVA